MKAGDFVYCKKKVLLPLALLCVIGLLCGIASEIGETHLFGGTVSSHYAIDLKLRRNEVCCAHQGVNSFHIWNRTAKLPGFAPLDRPDKPSLEETGRLVHAYPPWHTFFFYFYGWLDESSCQRIMTCVMLLAMFLIAWITFCFFKEHSNRPWPLMLMVMALISKPMAQCFYWHNYGILILAGLLMMGVLLKRGFDVMAGGVWAFMMVKPQVATLFFWPLLFSRKYKTICVAVVACLFATCVMGWVYGESPLALILQVPQIGLPYAHVNFLEGLAVKLCGNGVQLWWMAAFFFVCGGISFLLRNEREMVLRACPAALCVPFWTYVQAHDLMILWVFYAAFFLWGDRKKGYWMRFFSVLLVCSNFVCFVWTALALNGIWNPSGWGWLYRICEVVSLLLAVWLLAEVFMGSRQENWIKRNGFDEDAQLHRK